MLIKNNLSCSNSACIHFFKGECLNPFPNGTLTEQNDFNCESPDYGDQLLKGG
jgi:hypothetical protein